MTDEPKQSGKVDRYSQKKTASQCKTQSQVGTTQESTVQEIELVPAPNIFHNDESGLRHELIDAYKAKAIVSTLRQLKLELSDYQNNVSADGKLASDTSVNDALSITEDGKLSVNINSYLRTVEVGRPKAIV